MFSTTRLVTLQKCERSGRYMLVLEQRRCSLARFESDATRRLHSAGVEPGSVKTHMVYEATSKNTRTWNTPTQKYDHNVVCGSQSTYGP